MGRHYNILKSKPGGWSRDNGNSCRYEGHKDQVLGKEYGVNHKTIRNAGKFAAAVETLKDVDPEIEQKVVTGKGPTLDRPQCWTHLSFAVARPPLFPAHALRRGPVRQGSAR